MGFLTSALAMAMRCFCPPDSDTPFSPQSCITPCLASARALRQTTHIYTPLMQEMQVDTF